MVRLALTCILVTAASAEIIDRVAVSVGNQIITSDQIADEIRVTAFLNHVPPIFSRAEKRKAADRLIEQTLIRREIDLSHYPLPSPEEADSMLQGVQKDFPNGEEFLKTLDRYDITEAVLRQHLLWQLTTLRFIDERFRPSVVISDDDVHEAYDQQVEKLKSENASQIPTYETLRPKLEAALTDERVDQALDRWLGDARRQVDIRFRDGAFQ
ncbi:MAG TPA: hypothetical protein VKU01_12505 [Bryobacteraceae bacterium]|nr:hypothetical protein [Bryobacteraceae bacterium]